MYYIYILQSEKDLNYYTGYTSDLRKRILFHNEGKVSSTCLRRPLRLVYFEGCLSQKDALHREKYLKTSWGKKYIKNRLKDYLTGLAEASTTEIAKDKDAQGFVQNKQAAKAGGNVAKAARKKLEDTTGKKVISPKNFLAHKKTKNLKE